MIKYWDGEKMPLLRKVLQHGDSKAVTLPKSWLENAEQEAGKKIIAIAMEVNGSITLMPVFEKTKTP
jgi:antitoxin component of MazEF toxin-antitoxin module